MKPAKTTTRLFALFVVAFLCLNAGAFLCLAHCNITFEAAADHCPLKKDASAHCNRSQNPNKESDTDSLAGNAAVCCLMPVGVLAAPLENKSGTITAVAVAPSVEKVEFAPVVLSTSRQISTFYYRPPPNDARTDRVRNQVFRI